MSAQALSHVTFRRTRLLYIPIKKMTIRTRAIKIIQPIIGQPHAGRSVCALMVVPIYLLASATVKNWRAGLYADDTATNCYLWRIFLHWFMLRPAFHGFPAYALQNAQRFCLWHRRLPS